MFRRKSGEASEARHNQEDGPHTNGGRERFAPASVNTGATVMFHPDVPNRSNQVKSVDGMSLADGESRRLIVGNEITLTGCTISDCERLIVEGGVEATLTDGGILEIATGGHFKGAAVVESAEISGIFEGDLRVKKRLYIRASGYVIGTVRYGQLEIERGGRVDGSTEYDPAEREFELQPVDLSSPDVSNRRAGGR